ncbi:MAG: DUF305 domain-containing protein [Solimonas sp.]
MTRSMIRQKPRSAGSAEMKLLRLFAAASLLAMWPGTAAAMEYRPDEDRGHRDTVAYTLMLLPDGAAEALMRRDLKFADEMIEHHRGAVRMSQAYLQDARGQNSFLRRMGAAIIENQRFEIGWLEDLRRRVAGGPQTLVAVGGYRLVGVPAGVHGMEHRARFYKTPVSSIGDLLGTEGKPVSAFDVMFAKAMIMHHAMALDMARAYDADPNGQNVVIRELNFDILRDQSVEIGMLENVIARFPGDADAVPIDPEMHEMMGMPHSGM